LEGGGKQEERRGMAIWAGMGGAEAGRRRAGDDGQARRVGRQNNTGKPLVNLMRPFVLDLM